jgi:hypothetical protein
VNPVAVVLRVPSGSRVRGKLQVISVTGGLLSLSELLEQGSVTRVMFMTDVGSVQGTAEMLVPISATLQPFRFVAIDHNDQSRIKDSIESGTEKSRRDRQSLVHHRAS